MKTKKLLFSFFLVVFISCNSSSTFREFDKMPENNRWEKSDVKQYEFEIKDNTTLYNFVFKFSHIYDYQFANIPVQFVIENPDGQRETLAVDLPIKESNGQQIADCSGDVCDLDYRIKTKTKLTNGKYKITISHDFKQADYLPNVLGVGLEVDKAE
ncbi:hypothetical protein [Flavobacterium sp.]|uniref:hypothetical protein n=1 Tax=Flavobacterium sp. TaxID=239 RepID=UPI00391B7F03